MAAKIVNQKTPPSKNITEAVATLQRQLAAAHEEFHTKLKDEEKRSKQIEAVIRILTSVREFHSAIGTNPEQAAMLTTIRANVEDIREGKPSKLFQVATVAGKPPRSRSEYETLVPASAAVAKLIESGMTLEQACRYVINYLTNKGAKLPLASDSMKPDWEQLKLWRINFVSGKRDVSNKEEEKFAPNYEWMINEFMAGYPPKDIADQLLNTIPRLMS